MFLELVRGLPARGWNSVPVVPEVDWLAAALRDEGFVPPCVAATGRFDISYARRLRSIVRREQISLVQTHLLATSVYATLACLGTDVPVVSTFHGHPDISRADRLAGLKARILTRSRNRVVCVSESLRDHFERSVPFRRDAEVIPNGIDTTAFSPGRSGRVRAELAISSATPLVGAIGNIRASKDYPTLFAAFARVRQAVPDARLVIAGQGSGSLYENLLRQRTDLGLEGAIGFLGFRSDVADVLRSLDLFVLSSSDEGFSLATVQAMATGLPVVATRCGGPEQIVGASGAAVFVSPRDPAALAEGMLRVLRDPGLARRLGDAGRTRAVDAFSIERMLDSYSDLYARCLSATED